jgi:(p)ppGpp synthase/HD superfamily hydrolase
MARPRKDLLKTILSGCKNDQMRAMRIMESAHADQTRKISGDPFYVHPRRVGLSFSDPVLRSAGYLHDVIEDTDWTYQDLHSAGISKTVTDILYFLTQKSGETYFDYILRLMHCTEAVQIKLVDLLDNMQDWPKEGSMKDKWRLTYYLLSNGKYPPA